MKHTFHAALAACIAMLVTGGFVAFATAAPQEPAHEVPAEVEGHLDEIIATQLRGVKHRLADR